MKVKKSFILPIVLIVFSVTVVVSVSMYYRYLNSYNFKLASESKLLRKLENISISEISKSNNMLNVVNSRLSSKDIREKIDLTEISVWKNGKAFEKFVDKYKDIKIELVSKNLNKFGIFAKRKLKNHFYQRDTVINFSNLKFNPKLQFKFVDKNRIENILLDTQLNKFLEEGLDLENFYFKIDDKNKYKNLINRIFSQENGGFSEKNFRVFDFKKSVYLIENSVFENLLKNYILECTDKVDFSEFDFGNLNFFNLDKFFELNKFKNCSKQNFAERHLLLSSEELTNDKIFNISIEDKIIIDFEEVKTLNANILLKNEESKIITKNINPTVKGIFVNNSNCNDFSFLIEGILFSKLDLVSNYNFNPLVCSSMTKFIKISNEYYIEKIN